MDMRRYLFLSLSLFVIVGVGAWLARSFGFYNSYWFTDVALHAVSGAGFGLIWLAMNQSVEKRFWMLALGAASFAVLGSVAWEIWEFAGWRVTPSHMRFYIPELGDSLGDICAGFIGGLMLAMSSIKNRR